METAIAIAEIVAATRLSCAAALFALGYLHGVRGETKTTEGEQQGVWKMKGECK